MPSPSGACSARMWTSTPGTGLPASEMAIIVAKAMGTENTAGAIPGVGWTLANPGIVSIPLGFIGCWLGTMLTTERGAERTFAELHVRSETGIGAERAAV
jgi:cation/acetate symporter